MKQPRRTRVEDYLAAIDQICEESGLNRASTGAIARTIGVSKGTVSSVLKELAQNGLVDHVPYEGAILSDTGQKQARLVIRRSRLIELFLSKTLGVNWETVADEAWCLEPVTSDNLIELMNAFLGHPEFDPHGDPIPRIDGTLPESNPVPLSTRRVGEIVILRRVKSQSESVLRFLREAGLSVGTELVIKENYTRNEVVRLETTAGSQTLGYSIASQLLVRPIQLTEP